MITQLARAAQGRRVTIASSHGEPGSGLARPRGSRHTRPMRWAALAMVLAAAGCNQVFGLDAVRVGDGGATSDGPAGDGTASVTDGPTCGDGTVDDTEECDDFNRLDRDGCDASCHLELDVIGCADGHREGFADLAALPGIAACGGGWTVGGLQGARSGVSACVRAGDDGPNPDGTSCAALDLCAPGWTICGGRGAVATALGVAACTPGAGFFATREKGSAAFECLGTGAMVMGCGSVGVPVTMGCAPLTAAAASGCAALVGWRCGVGDESGTAVHGLGDGGVLCCR